MKRFTLCLTLALVALGCANISVNPNGTRTVQTFGAVTTTVEQDGAITTESKGVSDGLVGMVAGVVDAAKGFALGFFGRAATDPTIIVNNPAPAATTAPAVPK